MKRVRPILRPQPEFKPSIPQYLSETYWWAYIHPNAVWVFERQWIVNLILWGNFYKLRNLALSEIPSKSTVLQVACVYGDFTEQLSKLHPDSDIHVVDVAQIQLDNLAKKVKNMENVSLYQQDSSQLQFIDSQFDSVIVFFLLHEMPQEVRAKTIEEALRVLKPGGKAVFVDYHRPYWANPFRYIMYPVLKFLEPFALDLWSQEISTHMKDVKDVQKITYFGGLYQKVVVTK